jgi:hypothetical protein
MKNKGQLFMESLYKRSSNPKSMGKQGQFFIMSIVLIAMAMFLLVTFYLTIDETTVLRSDSSSRIQIKNIQNIIDDPDNCQGNITLCDHFKDIYGGKFKLTCSTIGEGAPFNYSIDFDSEDTEFSATLTQDLTCVGGGGGATCGNGVIEGGELCDSGQLTACSQPGFEIYFTDDYEGGDGECSAKAACDITCSQCATIEDCNGGGAGG